MTAAESVRHSAVVFTCTYFPALLRCVRGCGGVPRSLFLKKLPAARGAKRRTSCARPRWETLHISAFTSLLSFSSSQAREAARWKCLINAIVNNAVALKGGKRYNGRRFGQWPFFVMISYIRYCDTFPFKGTVLLTNVFSFVVVILVFVYNCQTQQQHRHIV